MGKHTARSLFAANMQGAQECVRIFEGVRSLASGLELEWLLRSAIVLAVSAMDAYFHDKIRYRAGGFPLHRDGEFTIESLPKQFSKLEVPLSELLRWQKAKRKGNVLRHWAVEHLAVRSLQSPSAIAEALKLVGINNFWNTIEASNSQRQALLAELNELVKRRNQIAHEGDRLQSRSSGKRLRSITREYTVEQIRFIKRLVEKTEDTFPN